MSSRSTRNLRFNPASPGFSDNLYAVYEGMRRDQPLVRLGRTWILTRYGDVLNALKDKKLASDTIPRQLHGKFLTRCSELSPPLQALLYGIVLFEEGDPHRLHRQALLTLFSDSPWQDLQNLVAREADQLAEDVLKAQQFDGITDIAAPLWDRLFTQWLSLPPPVQKIVSREKRPIRLLLDPSAIDEPGMERLLRAMQNLDRVFKQLLAGDFGPYDSLFLRTLSKGYHNDPALLNERFSIDCITLLIGGSETSEALIGNLLFILTNHPQRREQVLTTPSGVREIVLETMRFESPLQMVRRGVTTPLELYGRELRPGDNLLLCLGSANRDESIFERPDQFIPGRKNAQRQLGFGAGAHLCIGQTLARLQAEQMTKAMLSRLPAIYLNGHAHWQQQSLILRALASLPLSIHPVTPDIQT
jgi:cytochrome P450